MIEADSDPHSSNCRGPRTMILVDPALQSAPSPKRLSVELPAGPVSPARNRVALIPSARALTAYLKSAQQAVRLRGTVTVLLTSDKELRRLNRQFRGKDKATDVLSFPTLPGPERAAGDLAISVDTAKKQAAEHGHPLATEIKVLMLHGLLHLAGYDHETDNGEMHAREQVLRAKLGLPQGLIERAGSVLKRKASRKAASRGSSRSPRSRKP